MSKIFEFIEFIFNIVQWGIDFIKQIVSIFLQGIPIMHSLLETAVVHAPVLCIFFTFFLTISVILFIWRLIP